MDDFINADLTKADALDLVIFTEGTVWPTYLIPLFWLLLRKKDKCDFQVLQVLNCILNPDFLSEA